MFQTVLIAQLLGRLGGAKYSHVELRGARLMRVGVLRLIRVTSYGGDPYCGAISPVEPGEVDAVSPAVNYTYMHVPSMSLECSKVFEPTKELASQSLIKSFGERLHVVRSVPTAPKVQTEEATAQ